jgi:hypothetical protein
MTIVNIYTPEMIYWQRQGVSETIRSTFGSCPCEAKEKYYVEVHPHLGRYSYYVEVAYPQCNKCFATQSGQIKLSQELRRYYDLLFVDNGGTYIDRRRQDELVIEYADLARRKAEDLLREQWSNQIDFHPGVRAYSYNTEESMIAYPRTRSDYYMASAICYGNTITDIKGRALLFIGVADPKFLIPDNVSDAERQIIDAAIRDYARPSNRHKSEKESRGYLTWLISEHLTEDLGAPWEIRQTMFAEEANAGNQAAAPVAVL